MAKTSKISRRRDSKLDHERNSSIRVRVSAEEKEKFEQLAKGRHTDVSELVRQLLHKEADSSEGKAA